MAARRKDQNQQTLDRRSQVLRLLPPIDECLRAALREPTLSGFAHGYLRVLLRRAQAALRARIVSAAAGATPTRAGLVAHTERYEHFGDIRCFVRAFEPPGRDAAIRTGFASPARAAVLDDVAVGRL